MRASSNVPTASGVPSFELLSTTRISYDEGSAVWRSSAAIARFSDAARLYVGRMMLSFGWDIRQPPDVGGIEVAAHGLPRLHVQHRGAVPPVERGASARRPYARADGIDPRLEAQLRTEELDPPAAGLQIHDAVLERGGVLTVERPSVARVIEPLDDRVRHRRRDLEIDHRREPAARRGPRHFAPRIVAERDPLDAC